jgi:hypothetical protein
VKIKTYIFVVVFLVLLIWTQAQTEPTSITGREYQLKAAFLYNFIMFIDWPPEKMAGNEPIIIGVIGKDPFGDAFEPIKGKQVNNRQVVVKRFKGFEEFKKADQAELDQLKEAIKKCHVLYICRSETKTIKEITDLIKGHGVLTVGSVESFVESDGRIINFIVEEDKIRFEINVTAAREAKLQIRSQLLRLAKRIIGEAPPEVAKD